VARELELYAPLVHKGGYLIVLDTVIEDMPTDYFTNRPWDKGNNPMTAVRQFLRHNAVPQMDKLLVSAAPSGFLLCIRNAPKQRSAGPSQRHQHPGVAGCRTRLRFPIIVADGSALENAARNAECSRNAGSNASYFHLPSPPIASRTPSLKQYESFKPIFRGKMASTF
jgi:hypothetical protein